MSRASAEEEVFEITVVRFGTVLMEDSVSGRISAR